MDDAVHMVLPDEFAHLVEIANVRFDESIVRPVFDVFQIGQVSGVGQLVQVDNMVVRILVDEKAYHVACDSATQNTGSSGNDDISFKIHDVLHY